MGCLNSNPSTTMNVPGHRLDLSGASIICGRHLSERSLSAFGDLFGPSTAVNAPGRRLDVFLKL